MGDVEDKFGAYDYERAVNQLFELQETGSMENFASKFGSLQFLLEMLSVFIT